VNPFLEEMAVEDPTNWESAEEDLDLLGKDDDDDGWANKLPRSGRSFVCWMGLKSGVKLVLNEASILFQVADEVRTTVTT